MENIVNTELVEQVSEQVADQMVEQISTPQTTTPIVAPVQTTQVPSGSSLGKNLAWGVGGLAVGVGGGIALDKWVFPWLEKKHAEAKVRRAKKKAEKAAKKAAKEAAKVAKNAPQTAAAPQPAPEPKPVDDATILDSSDITIE